ncbi:hypothetical protein [Rhodococcus sp. YH1]|uniref:hypothetical protein n=1 Tax=Rhodococcus sp. YH1 TaxID=89066 RepID=UPI0013870FC7
MADTDRTRRFRRTRPPTTTEDPAAYIDARAGRRGTPSRLTTAQAPRPASVQARQDVVDVVAFIREVDTERSQGRPVPRPQPMQTILGAFHGSPATQTTVQILAAAATARHFGGENSTARKWEKLAQDNAARLDAVRAQQYRQQQSRYVQAQLPPEEIDRRISERVTADRQTDRRAFDAAGALALSYVAVKSLPAFDKLTELSHEHLVADMVPEPEHTSEAARQPTRYPDGRVGGEAPDLDASRLPEQADAVTEVKTGIDLAKKVAYDEENTAEALADADVSDELQQVPAPDGVEQRNGRDLSKLGPVLETAGRGVATAVGPVNGEDDIASPLSPVDLNQLSQELLSAVGAAMSSHPRLVTEMLNIESEPDPRNEAAFVPDMGVEHGQEATLGY